MTKPLVECIPNFSEARRPNIIEEIIKAMTVVPGITILDRHSDLDHNRTVITYIGEPTPVENAAFNAIAAASNLIDLNIHRGEHPRIGATDVVPFVPIRDISMIECIEIARRLGKRVGNELNLPVYLYEEAATRPERQNLENIRRGQYETLKEEIGIDAGRIPDFGPRVLGPAGATVIGARQPLIAFNVYLTTENVNIAQKIAKSVRNSNGGLRYVKAMGVLVNGRAQVSMNFTNFRQSPIALVVEIIRREAARYGVNIVSTELVGLTPQEALIDAATWYLQLDDFYTEQILEQKLYNAPATGQSGLDVRKPSIDFLDELASGKTTPGGGSASAHTAAAAAALVAMVGRVTVGKKKYAAVENQMWSMIEQAETLRESLTKAVSEDSVAFEALMKATHLPKENPEQVTSRENAIREATFLAAHVPLDISIKSVSVLELVQLAASTGNVNAISDAGTAAALARAALTGAGLNVRTNLKTYPASEESQKMLHELSKLEENAHHLEKSIHSIIGERGMIDAYR